MLHSRDGQKVPSKLKPDVDVTDFNHINRNAIFQKPE